MRLLHARGELDVSRCLVMGVVNRTPDSFYDGGRTELEQVVRHALDLVDQGADLLDIGAVRAGPGAPVGEAEEMQRLLPVVELLARESPCPLSVDTSRPAVARAAIDAGAVMVNDVSGLSDEGVADVCAATGAALVLMHHGGQIRGRPRHPSYDDVVADVKSAWRDLMVTATARGVRSGSLVVDPGLDFGKNTFHSLELVRRLRELTAFGPPLLVAASRKDVVGETLDLPPEERLEGSLAVVTLSVLAGASLIRAHDVRATVRTVRMVEAVEGTFRPVAPVRGLWD